MKFFDQYPHADRSWRFGPEQLIEDISLYDLIKTQYGVRVTWTSGESFTYAFDEVGRADSFAARYADDEPNVARVERFKREAIETYADWEIV